MRVNIEMVTSLQDHGHDGVQEGFHTCGIKLEDGRSVVSDETYRFIYLILHNMRGRGIENSDTEHNEMHFDFSRIQSRIQRPDIVCSNDLIINIVNRRLTELFQWRDSFFTTAARTPEPTRAAEPTMTVEAIQAARAAIAARAAEAIQATQAARAAIRDRAAAIAAETIKAPEADTAAH